MKKLSLFILLLLSTYVAFAQVPQRINYQAVARNTTGAIVANTPLKVRYTIHDGSATGAVLYQETHTGLGTNQFGLFTAAIGAGTVNSGTFSTIAWGSADKYLQVEIDINL